MVDRSEMSFATKLELLPNEILVECFEYLNGADLFHSFDQLNDRFNALIRNIWLHVDFSHIRKSTFDEFCFKILSNSKIRNQICSLKLSNKKETCKQIEVFLSTFSLNQFCHLRSLSLIRIDGSQMETILPMLFSLSHLCYLHVSSGVGWGLIRQVLPSLPLSRIRTLVILWSIHDSIPVHTTTSITNLTLKYSSLSELNQFFKCAPMLKCLHVASLFGRDDFTSDKCHPIDTQALCLKTLFVSSCLIDFDLLQILLKQIPNLKSLTLSLYKGKQMADAGRWEDFISFSLPHLTKFKFAFEITLKELNGIDWTIDNVFDRFQQFQTNFWHKQHQWHTEYQFDKNKALIYTIPYILDTYKLTQNTNRSCHTLINTSKSFDNVNNLILFSGTLEKKCQHYFSNVQSLTLSDEYVSPERFDQCPLKTHDIQSLKMILNLSNLKHLTISWLCRMNLTSIFIEIFQEASQLSSIRIERNILISLLHNSELSKYFNKRIRKLDIAGRDYDPCIPSNHIQQFCQTFANIQQLRCFISESDDFISILKRLTKLVNITVAFPCLIPNIELCLQNILTKLNKNCLFDHKMDEEIGSIYCNQLTIWIGANRN